MAGKVVVMIGVGANDVKIPCRIFAPGVTIEQAIQAVLDLLPESWEDGGNDCIEYAYDDEPDASDFNNIFTDYYGGCGGCYGFEFAEVEFNSNFVGWNLD